MTEIFQRIQTSFDNQAMMGTFGAQLTEARFGIVTIQAPIAPAILQQQGLAHGGAVFTLGDSAAGYAALTTVGPDQEIVTAELKINYLAPGVGEFLVAKGRVIKPGRRLIVVSAEVFAQSGDESTPIAVLQGTMVPVSR